MYSCEYESHSFHSKRNKREFIWETFLLTLAWEQNLEDPKLKVTMWKHFHKVFIVLQKKQSH